MRHHNNNFFFDCKIQDVIHNNILLPAVLFHMRWIYINWFSKKTLCNELISYSTFLLFSIEDTYNRYQQFSGEGRNMNDDRNKNNVKILMWFFPIHNMQPTVAQLLIIFSERISLYILWHLPVASIKQNVLLALCRMSCLYSMQNTRIYNIKLLINVAYEGVSGTEQRWSFFRFAVDAERDCSLVHPELRISTHFSLPLLINDYNSSNQQVSPEQWWRIRCRWAAEAGKSSEKCFEGYEIQEGMTFFSWNLNNKPTSRTLD